MSRKELIEAASAVGVLIIGLGIGVVWFLAWTSSTYPI